MERCPIEVWQRILAFACTDGGYTSCSLSRVSRLTRLVVLPVRFTSVEINTQDRLLAFSYLLARWDSRANIRHLFITVDVPLWGPNTTRGERRAMLNAAFKYILTRAAPTLNTLVIHSPDTFDVSGTDIRFPYLTDLSLPFIRPSDSPFLPSDYVADTRPHKNLFPALERLHLMDSFNMRDSVWEEIAELTPSITTLRLSGVQSYTSLPKFLRVLLKTPVPEREDDDEPRDPALEGADAQYAPASEEAARAAAVCAFLPNLRHVSVQVHVQDDDGWCDTGMSVHGFMMNGLESIRKACGATRSAGRLYLSKKKKAYGVPEARQDWLSVVDGRDGPWPPETSQLTLPVAK